MGFNVNSVTHFEIQNLDINGYYHVQQLFGDPHARDNLKYTQKSVLHIEHVPWIGKHLAVVNEGFHSYFHTSQSIDIRRVDLMNYI